MFHKAPGSIGPDMELLNAEYGASGTYVTQGQLDRFVSAWIEEQGRERDMTRPGSVIRVAARAGWFVAPPITTAEQADAMPARWARWAAEKIDALFASLREVPTS